jgi:hypothetical protein
MSEMTEAPISREPTPRERLIVALDARSVAEAEHWIEQGWPGTW